VVAGLLMTTSAATGALAGLVAGAAALALDATVPWLVVAVVVGAPIALDAAGVAPLSVRRQVPQLWGRIFAAPTVAALYGARLGVGPLTILRTWLWWGAFVLGALSGPWWSAGVGATFGAGRILVMLATGTRAGSRRPAERWAAPALAVAVVAATVVAWGSTGGRDGDGDRDGREARRPATAATGEADAGEVDRARSSAHAAAATTSTASTGPVTAADQGLADALPGSVLAGFERVPDEARRRLGPLDLRAAAAVEGDEPAERALLETRRFQRGHARAWRGPGGTVAHASVYVFATSADAEAYRVDGLTTIEARGARVYDVDAPAGGRGFSQAGQAEAGAGSTVAHGVTFVRGDRFHLVFVTSPRLVAGARRRQGGGGGGRLSRGGLRGRSGRGPRRPPAPLPRTPARC
jgi:hypothetical protein